MELTGQCKRRHVKVHIKVLWSSRRPTVVLVTLIPPTGICLCFSMLYDT